MDEHFNFSLAMASHPVMVTDIFQDRVLVSTQIHNKRATGMEATP